MLLRPGLLEGPSLCKQEFRAGTKNSDKSGLGAAGWGSEVGATSCPRAKQGFRAGDFLGTWLMPWEVAWRNQLILSNAIALAGREGEGAGFGLREPV